MIYTLEGVPVAAARPRITRRGHAYNPHQEKIEAAYWELCSQNNKQKNLPLGIYIASPGPVEIIIEFHMPIPVYRKKSHKEGMPHDVKPDIDNMVKFVLDVGNNIFYEDDSQVVSLIAKKVYSKQPRTVIEVREIKNGK